MYYLSGGLIMLSPSLEQVLYEIEKGTSMPKIAIKFGVTVPIIKWRVKKLRELGYNIKFGTQKITRDWLYDEHVTKDKSIWQIHQETKYGLVALKAAMKRFNITWNKHRAGQKSGTNHSKWTGYGNIHGSWYTMLKNNAINRGVDFDVSIEYLWQLFIKQNESCALTGIKLTFQKYIKDSSATVSLDRIDSSKGYIEGNVQWVHKDINLMKLDMSQEEFINWCKLVAKNN